MLIAKLSSRPKAEMIIGVKSEAEGRGFNERLTPDAELIKDILQRNLTQCIIS